MPNIARLRQDLQTTKNLGDVVDVLKTAAMIQFRVFQSKEISPQKDFARIAEECLGVLFAKGANHPYLFDRKGLATAVVIITTDEGFLGELNTLLVNIGTDMLKFKNDKIIVLGERGARYLEDLGLQYTLFPGITDEIKYKEVAGLRDYLLRGFRRDFGRISIVYPRYFSVAVQRVEVLNLLPYLKRPQEIKLNDYLLKELLIEPSLRIVLESLVNMWAGFKLTEIFWTAKLAEYGARIMHLEGSTQELSHLNHKLSLDYFRSVHTLKDKSIREISASKNMIGRK